MKTSLLVVAAIAALALEGPLAAQTLPPLPPAKPALCGVLTSMGHIQGIAKELDCSVANMKAIRAYLTAGGIPDEYLNAQTFEKERKRAIEAAQQLVIWTAQARPDSPTTQWELDHPTLEQMSEKLSKLIDLRKLK